MNTVKLTILLGALAFSTGALAGGNAEAGKKKAEEICVACHGVDGKSPSDQFPHLAGQHEDYIVATLKKYKSGKRSNPIMAGMVAALTEQDIKNVAAWYSSQKAVLFLKY